MSIPTQPMTPDEVLKARFAEIPGMVFKAINELIVKATARQITEASLKSLGLWPEGEETP